LEESNEWAEIFESFDVKKKMGAGAFGTVVRATRKNDGLKVAIKYLKDAFQDLQKARRTLREVSIMR